MDVFILDNEKPSMIKYFKDYENVSFISKYEERENEISAKQGPNLNKKNRLSEVCDKLYRKRIELSSPKSTVISLNEIKDDSLKQFVCELCGKSFKHKSNLKEHSIVHREDKPYSCSICGKTFKRSNALNTHMIIHTAGRPYSCDTCGKSFTQRGNLNAHKLIHDGMKPFSCSECGKAFRQMRDLNKHKLNHTNERPFKCDHCGKCFKDKSTVKKHKIIHEREKGEALDANNNLVLNSVEKLNGDGDEYQFNHGVTLHDNSVYNFENRFQCDICGKDFRYRSNLTEHRVIHQEVKPFFCTICGKSFKRVSALNTHILIHSDEKPFSCDICGKKFSQKGNLNEHSIVHIDIKPFQCELCGKKFKRASSLSAHHMTHQRKNALKNLSGNNNQLNEPVVTVIA